MLHFTNTVSRYLCIASLGVPRTAPWLAALLVAGGCASVAPPQQQQAAAPIVTTVARADEPPSEPAAIPGSPVSVSVDTSERTATDPDAALALLPEPSGRPKAALTEGSLWDRIRAGFAMPELDTPLVAQKERFYLQQPEYLQRMFLRGSRYLFHIVEEIERRGMPTELALLPFVESAMNPTALSHAKAAGLWQFIPSTGRAYNLQQDWWVDNRRDVVQSTEAALDYLQKIYELQGKDWFLALASYNWGENAVARAVRRNEARGRPADYLSLSMPSETRHYVPKLIALKHILLRAEELGIALPELPNRPYFVTIEKTRPIDLKLAAQFAEMTVPEFVALNPAHNRPVIAASRNNQIKLPADRLDAFMDAVERHGKASRAFATWQPHTLKPGETLETLATRGGVAVAELRDANDLRAGQVILPGTRLLAPQRSVEDESGVEEFEGPRVYERIERPAAWHRVKNRDTLTSIARRYGTTVANLREWNGVGKSVPVGKLLKVRPAVSQTVLTTENGDRRVVRRDDEPRIVRAVLRREGSPEVQAENRIRSSATRSPAKRTSKASGGGKVTRAAAKRTATRAASTPSVRAATAAKRSNEQGKALRASERGPRSKRVDKRT